jgi:hypothetical protein
MVNPEFDWPPDIEASIQEHVRQHIRRGLKRRTWDGVHAELRANVPRHEGRWSSPFGHFYVCANELDPVPVSELLPVNGAYSIAFPEPNISEWFEQSYRYWVKSVRLQI